MTETEPTYTPPPWAGGPGHAEPITSTPHLTMGGDTLPSIAERCGHAGEWQAIAELNAATGVWGDYNNIQPGLSLDLPAEWFGAQTKPADSSQTVDLGSLSAPELVALAQKAETLAELDAIDSVARGRVTVLDAVDGRRDVLLGQGATA